MTRSLEEKLDQAIWIAHSLYNRGKTSGSSANISFIDGGSIYISASGTCFGTLTTSEFARTDMNGIVLSEIIPSKELELHRCLYNKSPEIGAVLHTHSTFATLWSCLHHQNKQDVIPPYTPYLRMKLGAVALVPYAKPGSEALFAEMRKSIGEPNGYLLQNHGPIVGAKTLMDAYFAMEELEESAKLAWLFRGEPNRDSMLIL